MCDSEVADTVRYGQKYGLFSKVNVIVTPFFLILEAKEWNVNDQNMSV
jgi:hypothetical protein